MHLLGKALSVKKLLGAAIITTVAALSIGCESLEQSCVESQDKVDWATKPVIDGQGTLTFSGNTKNGAPIDSGSLVPFNFSNRKDSEGFWNRRLAALGAIDEYTLSPDRTEFSVRYRVPNELLNRDRYDLVVGVWGQDVGQPLGAWCVKYE